MIKFSESEMLDVLSSPLKDNDDVIAISYALKMGMAKTLGYATRTRLYGDLESVPEEILDLLALESNTQYYDETLDISVKRALIKNTLAWYATAGTKAAVVELMQAAFGEGSIDEWYEYDGDPYYFRITTSATLSDDMLALFTSMLSKVKNVRSHIDNITVERDTPDATLYVGTVTTQQKNEFLINDFTEDKETYASWHALIIGSCEINESVVGNTARTITDTLTTETPTVVTYLSSRFEQGMGVAD